MGSNDSAKEEAWRRDIEKAQSGDRQIRNRLISENMGLVYMVVKRFTGRGVDAEELSQIGAIGLIKAVDRFDPKLPYSFSTYAVPLIMGEIRRFFRNDGMIHISRQLKENAGKIATFREYIQKTENRDPTLEEMSKHTGLSKEDLILSIEASSGVESLSSPIAGEDGKSITLEERIEDQKNFETPVLDRIALGQVLDSLEEGEAKLITLRYLENHTQSEVAGILGTSQVAVSRMEHRILKKLRRKLA